MMCTHELEDIWIIIEKILNIEIGKILNLCSVWNISNTKLNLFIYMCKTRNMSE